MANPQPRWYFLREEILGNTPSRRDGISWMMEAKIWKSYYKLLQDLGHHLLLPQETIATAIILCQRFFLYKSLAKNDYKTIAVACLLIAAKAKETPRSLSEVTYFSYVRTHLKDRVAVLKIMQKEIHEQQKELLRCAERLVLATLNFDFDVVLPYTTLVNASKRSNKFASLLAPTAWTLLRNWLQTSLYIQFEPHNLALAALHVASVICKNGGASDVGIELLREFNVNLQQLADICIQVIQFRNLGNFILP